MAAGEDKTSRKRAAEALRESEERFRGLFENSLNGFALHEIVTDKEGRPVDYVFLEVNPAFEELTGLKAKNIIGKRVTEALPGIEADPFIEVYGRVALTGEPIHFEQYASPLEKHFEIAAFSPKKRHFAVVFSDITERKRAAEALRESEERFRRLSEATLEGIVISEAGKILDANEQLAEMLGYSVDELIGMDTMEFVAPESRDLVIQNIASQYEVTYEHLAQRSDGSIFPVEVHGVSIPYGGRTARVTAIRDIAERKLAEEALQNARDELEGKVERQMLRRNPYGLTFRELTVLHLVAVGKPDKEIGLELGISPLTASKHLSNILAKMSVASRTEASVRAVKEGLLL